MFRRKNDRVPKKEIEEAPKVEPVETVDDNRTRTVVRRDPARVIDDEPAAVPEKKTTSKKTTSNTSQKKTTPKTSSKKTSPKKTSEREKKESTAGAIPSELKGLNKQLKAFAERSRMEFNAQNANAVFTEYMAKVFRDLRYRMLMIKDADEGIMTMLGNTADDISVKDKIVVMCVYMKKGSVTPQFVEQAQEAGALHHADETWCITTTDFTDSAVRKSKKQDAKVKLFDGKKLYKEFISKLGSD